MATFSQLQIPPPKNWQDFETLCCDLWRAIWNDPNAKKNGRQGQPQNGVDIYGNPSQQANWAGVQCKCKDNVTNSKLTEKELRTEVEKAKSFVPSLTHFTMATTGPRSATIQTYARLLSDMHRETGLFGVDVWSWDDIAEALDTFPNVVAQHFPQFALRRTVPDGFEQTHSLMRDLLSRQSHPGEGIEAVEIAVGQFDRGAPRVNNDEIVASFGKASVALTSRTVDVDLWIERPEEQQLWGLLNADEDRTICLLGVPGSGKTVLLAKIARDALAEGYATIAIKADLIPPHKTFASWGRDQLGLNHAIAEVVAVLSAARRVVVIIDQLDALASLVDLTSDRLNGVLEFIRECTDLPKVSIVCSCREFDFRHDTRFTTLDAECVKLEIPAWESIAPQLKKVGIDDADAWPRSFREILRIPQHLQLYLDRVKETGNRDKFGTYQNMLDDLWLRRLQTEEQRGFVYRLTSWLIDRESLSAPLVQFEADLPIIEQLESAHFLQRPDRQVEFRHQTLLEHAKARFFTKTEQSLCDHVLSRQNAILVRPTLWAVLAYLRGANRGKYHRELESLFGADLRLHVRFLLIDFLGQVPDPDEREVLVMTSRLSDPEDRIRVLLAIRGREAWFDALRSSHLPVLMRRPIEESWPLVGVLTEAWKFAREDCLGLIKQNWLADPTKDGLTTRAFAQLDRWDQESVDMVCQVIHRSPDGGERLWWAEQLVYTVSKDEPTLAPQVFAAVISREKAELPSGNTDSPLVRSRQSPLESRELSYSLPDVAKAAPLEFLRVAWPWFVENAVQFHNGPVGTVVNEYGGSLFALDPDADHPGHPATSAVRMAVEAVAKSDPRAFFEITRPSWTVENAPVQRVLAQGLAAVATIPEVGLEFLSGDPRRLMLGDYDTGEQSDSAALIAAVAPHLDLQGRQELEQTILAWSRYRPNADLEEFQYTCDREHRLRLLKAIPADLMSNETAEFVDKEAAELPEWDRQPRHRSRGGWVKDIPPLTKDEMATASDETILETLREPFDRHTPGREWKEVEGGWEEPGGAAAAAKELAELAKENPHRVIPLLSKLIAEGNEFPAGEVLYGLVNSPLTDDEVYDLIRVLARAKPTSDSFRRNAGLLLHRRCRENVGLPDDICALLESWLEMPWRVPEGGIRSFSKEDEGVSEERKLTSVLWAPTGGILDADDSFWPLVAGDQRLFDENAAGYDTMAQNTRPTFRPRDRNEDLGKLLRGTALDQPHRL